MEKTSIKMPKWSVTNFVIQSFFFGLLIAIIWNLIFNDINESISNFSNLIGFVFGIGAAIARLDYKQRHYIILRNQDVLRIANDIDLTRQHLQKLKSDLDSNQPQESLLAQIHRYEDQLTSYKINYNTAVEDYNIAIKLLPVRYFVRQEEKDYYSDFFV